MISVPKTLTKKKEKPAWEKGYQDPGRTIFAESARQERGWAVQMGQRKQDVVKMKLAP